MSSSGCLILARGPSPDLSVIPFEKALRAAHGARVICTPNDAPFIPGVEAWATCLRVLREELLRNGWRKHDLGNYSLIINDVAKINIVVSSGDALTGHRHGVPRTRSLKGLYTEAAIARNTNATEDLFKDLLPESVARKAAALVYPTWIFLMYVTDTEARGELSQPSAISEKEVTSWSERIIIPDIDLGDGTSLATPDGPDGEPDIEVEISRKS